MFAAPAKTSHSNRKAGSFVSTQGLKKLLDDRKCVAVAIVVDPGKKGIDTPKDMISTDANLC